MLQQSGEEGWRAGRRTMLAAGDAAPLAASLALSLAVLLALLLALPGAAAAQDDPPPTPAGEDEPIEVPDPVPGQEVCTITDPRLVELSGLVATDDGYIVINDSQLPGFESRLPIFFLDQACQVVDEQSFLPGRPRDPEDLELDYDTGTLWVGDIGDNSAGGTGEGDVRENVGLWRVDLTGGDRTPVIHRFTYPDGQAHDAEALLLDADGIPIIITKAALGPTELFQPTELRPSEFPEDTVPLEKVGEVQLPDTGTEHRFGAVARRVVTGGSVAPDRSRVVIRTYTDAFEFDVTDGDVVGAITTGRPRVTPLPGEPQGEAITYSPDGQDFLTVSDAPEDQVGDFVPVILRYTPTPPAPEPPPADEAPPPADSSPSGFSLLNNVQDILNTIAAVGLFGLLLVIVGVIGIVRSRRRPPRGQPDRRDDPDGRAGDGGLGNGGLSDGEPAASPAVGRVRPGAGPRTGPRAGAGTAVAAVAGAAVAAGATAAVATARPVAGADRPDPEPGWEPGWGPDPSAAAQHAGVYTSRAAGHAEPAPAHSGPPEHEQQVGYGRAGYEQAGYEQAEYGRAGYEQAEYGRAEYGRAGYEQAEYGQAEYGPAEYDDGRYEQAGYDAGYDRRAGYPPAGHEQGAYDQSRYEQGRYERRYPDQPYDQDWSGGHDPRYQETGYQQAGYQDAGYQDAGYQPDPDEVYDDYSEDPDYHYEFRDRGRW